MDNIGKQLHSPHDAPRSRCCTICKHRGLSLVTESRDLEKSLIFSDEGASVTILLCRNHSVSLFKLGQRKFLMKHYRILVDTVDSDEEEFLDILEATVRKYKDQIA